VFALTTSQMKFKVAFITEQVDLGGGETSLLYLMKYMDGLGHDTFLFCPPGKFAEAAQKHGINVRLARFRDAHLRLGIFPTISLVDLTGLTRSLKSIRVDLIHAESPLGVLYGGLASFLLGKPCVATCHGYWPIHSHAFRQYIRIFIRSVFPVSVTVAEGVKAALGDSGKRISVIPLGVDDSITENLPARIGARERLDLPQDRALVMQVARFQDIKGQMNLLRAYKELLKKGKRVSLVYVGEEAKMVGEESRAYMDEVVKRAENVDKGGDIRFLKNRDDVHLLMRAADIIVVPSEYETFGMALIEAMAVGTPVVATDCGGPSEIIENGVTGLLVPPNDCGALSKAILEVLSKPGLAAQLADNAKEMVKKKYSIEARYSRLKEEYDRVVRWGLNVRAVVL